MDEVEFYLSDTKAKLLLVHRGAVKESTAAVKAAQKLGVVIAEVWHDGRSMKIQVEGPSGHSRVQNSGNPGANDVALLLHVRTLLSMVTLSRAHT